jgi:two-component system sensor histidine kinase MprB
VQEVLDDLRPQLAGVEVTLSVATCTAACTPGVLAQLVRNVVGNAIKYRGADRPLRVQIDASARTPEAPLIEIVVTDNGVGMTREAVDHAFDPFYRASATRAIPGNGLGLSIVKRTLDAMGGDCQLASTPNQGTRVILRVPVAS